MAMSARPCMVCKKALLKGFFKYRNDPICIQCHEDIRDQRRLLTEKYRIQDRIARNKARKEAAS